MHILFVFLTESNWCIDLTGMFSLRSKLANIIIERMFWLVAESLGGVWVFFSLLITHLPTYKYC